jgi:hypothetical protein
MNIQNSERTLSPQQSNKLLNLLQFRFEENKNRHEGILWSDVHEKLKTDPGKLWSLNEMEHTGGEPDVVGYDKGAGEFVFYDCSPESPIGRRNVCYDQEAWESRKRNQPETNALDMADAMGIEILTEAQYRSLQELGSFDLKTSSWVKTPPEIRKLGGAVFCDRRYNTVFLYHNGASSYYGVRGFRGSLRV